MTSGAMLFEHEVMPSNKPAALQVLVALTDNPGGTVKPVFGVPAPRRPFEAKAVCEDLNRHTEPGDLVPVFHEPDRRLARPVEAHDVLRVDGQRRVLGAVEHADAVLGQQAPFLTGAHVEVVVVVVVGEIGLAHTRRIAVALPRIRGLAAPRKSISK